MPVDHPILWTLHEFLPALWAAFDATCYAGGRTTIAGEEGQQPENVRVGMTAARP